MFLYNNLQGRDLVGEAVDATCNTLTGTGYDDVDCVQLAQDSAQRIQH
jgi:hypothetical protein